jgi:hypothetical protein
LDTSGPGVPATSPPVIAISSTRRDTVPALSVTGGEVVHIVDSVVATSFEVVDRGVYHLERVSGNFRLAYFDFASRQSTVIASNLGSVSLGLSASTDGRAILFSRIDSSVDDLMLVEGFR